VLEDVKGVFALGLAAVVKTIALDTISCVDQEQI
jgi:hypothetical protein